MEDVCVAICVVLYRVGISQIIQRGACDARCREQIEIAHEDIPLLNP